MKRSLPFKAPRAHLPRPSEIRLRLIASWRDPRFRLRAEFGLVVALAVGLLLSIALFAGISTPLDSTLTDLLYQPFKPSGDVAVIAIDKKSLDELGPFPWNRTTYSGLLSHLSSAPPRVVVFDLLLPQSTPEDQGLAAALRSSNNGLLTSAGVEAAAYPPQRNILPQFDVLLLPAPELRAAAAGIGHRNLQPDMDGVLRRVAVAVQADNVRYPALGLIAAQKYLRASDIGYDLAHRQISLGSTPIQVDDFGRMLLNFTGMHEGLPTYSYSDVYQGRVPASTFAGKMVFIGVAASSELEVYATPLTQGNTTVYNVMIQAGLADMLVSSPPHVLQQQDALDQIGLTILVAIIAGLTLPHLRPNLAAALTIVYLLGLLLFAFEEFSRGQLLRILFPGLALLLTFVCVGTFRYLSEERRRHFLATLFRRYVPAESVGQVVDAVDRGELALNGVRRTVTVLYADLRGLSTLSDGLEPAAVLELVNRHLELIMGEIQIENGTVSKPMGDALVAIWNAPLDQPDHAQRAARAAVNIRRSLLRFQESNAEEQSINIGLGLSTGSAILGNISALGKVEYTLVGETVNVAARISAFAGSNQILADVATAQALPKDIETRELPAVRIRGRKEPLPVWEVRDTGEPLEMPIESDE